MGARHRVRTPCVYEMQILTIRVQSFCNAESKEREATVFNYSTYPYSSPTKPNLVSRLVAVLEPQN